MAAVGLLKVIGSLTRRLGQQVQYHATLVDSYAFAEAILYDSFQTGFVVNDYLHFCHTKSARSLAAANTLVEGHFHEDATVLLRGVYENYIHFQYVLQHPMSVHDFVSSKIGLSSRRHAYAPTKRGGKNPSRVVDTVTGEEHRYGRGLSEMVRAVTGPLTISLHELMYEYLSEHAHNHFMSFGSYLDPQNKACFSSDPRGVDLQVAIYALLLSSLWLKCYPSFEEIDESDTRAIKAELRKAQAALNSGLRELIAEDKYVELKAGLQALTADLRNVPSNKRFQPTGLASGSAGG